ncbi:sugar ABC transporter substrate-binding protein [Ahrensia kielensis]|uniref:Sugar ABC transporter substrate-binding protein n=1 Tax=Ahrensia kielensis TaxID=76980 RepID=A0ABU9T1G7_9HYPH
MQRRTFMKLAGTAAAVALASPAIAKDVTVRWWYHLDDPRKSPSDLIKKFEAANPGIKIEAENIPWGGGGDYYNRLFAALAAGTAPDCAILKVNNQSQLMKMGVLAPMDEYLNDWAGRSDIPDDIWRLVVGADGQQYYLPLHYVILYLYYRVDRFAEVGLEPPKTFDDFTNAAQELTGGDRYGFGMRSAAGGYDNWGPFVLGDGASFEKGGLITEEALAANRRYVNLALEKKVVPPSAAADGFRQIIDGFKAGRTSMIINHLTTANEIVESLGDNVSAVPVPRQPGRDGWTVYGDESNGIFRTSANKEAAFKWIAFLSEGENNADWCRQSSQFPVVSSAADNWNLHGRRFVDASVQSLPFAQVLPRSTKTADFTRTVWQANMQRALLGQISPDDMMRNYEAHFHG